MNPNCLSAISYGLYIVTSKQGSRLNGQVANTVVQITSEPPALAISINKRNLTWECINQSRVFAVSVLCQDTPLDFIGHFGFKSGREIDKLAGSNYFMGQTGVPVVQENAGAWMEARVVGEMDAGTHTIFLGQLVAGEVLSEKPVMTYEYYRQVKRGTTPRAAPTYLGEKKEALPQMDRYKCKVCGWIYDPAKGDPDGGIAPGTPFEKIPDSWVCPVCGAPKGDFIKIEV